MGFDFGKISDLVENIKDKDIDIKSIATEAISNISENKISEIIPDLLSNFKNFENVKELAPDSEEVQSNVESLKNTITEKFFPCDNNVLALIGNFICSNDKIKEFLGDTLKDGIPEFISNAIKSFISKK